MKKSILALLIFTFLGQADILAWGATGHRVVGQVAWNHMNKKARKNVQAVLGAESLAMASTYMDFIKSNPDYKKYDPWHYCTLHDALNYDSTMAPEEGDAVMAINQFVDEIKSKQFTQDEAFALKCLVHLVGDIHQPLHCGNGKDRGGNDVKIEFFYKPSNLHRVWDSGIIDEQNLSYTEYTSWVDVATKDQIEKWQNSHVVNWVNESKALHPKIYQYPENGKLSYGYVYNHIEDVNTRLLQAGIRLAALLNELYG